jgi:hypothetical protein
MNNRPDKPGLYWWEDHKGCFHVAEFDDDMETIDTISCDWLEYVNPEEFEESHCFVRWLCQAHPPKLESATVHEMVSQWIARNGADGLWNEEGPCGCDGSAPCGDGPYPKCKAAVAVDEDGNGVDFLYYPVTMLPYWDSND